MNIRQRLALLVAAFVVAFFVFGAVAFDTLNALKVNGPYYRQIVTGKDLVADILPPPEYVLEAYLVAHQAADPANRTYLAGLTAKSEALRQDYIDRHTFWAKALPDSTDGDKQIRQAMLEDSYRPALEFLNTVHDQLLPAVRRGDYRTAAQLLHGPLQRDYETHRAAINQVVVLTNTNNQIIEANAARIIVARLVVLAVLGVAIVAGLALSLSRFLRSAIAEGVAEQENTLSRTAPDAVPDGAGHSQSSHAQSLSKIVSELASQTSTLALEAARSSEQDRGFHLVAAEFRYLADENAKLSQQISRLVEHLQNTSQAPPWKVNKETP